ncbi:hypothetical protein ACEWY4_009003 [Coilia grayii]|uniref:RING-type E3 ubiquitin transferase n=1 Tax=Coilia grayii TaxID=363190 RepID=A0ABD1K579_9TELE
MPNHGRKRKRRCSRTSRPAQPDGSYGLPTALSPNRDSPLPGPSCSSEQQLRNDVLLSDDEDSGTFKRFRPGTEPPHDVNSSPIPGTSHDLLNPTEVPRVMSPSVPRAEIPDTTISDENEDDHDDDDDDDDGLLSMGSRGAAPDGITDDAHQDDADDVIFVGVIRPPQAPFINSDEHDQEFEQEGVIFVSEIHPVQPEPQFLLALQMEDGVLFIINRAANITEDLPTVIFDPQNPNNDRDHRDCRICLADYEEGEELMVLPCRHTFHSSCARHWLQENPTCPLCRMELWD